MSSLIIEKRRIVRGGGGSRGTDVNYKERVIYAERRNGKNERHNSLFFNAHSFALIYYGAHAHRGLASFQSVGCSVMWCESNVAYSEEVYVSYSRNHYFHSEKPYAKSV